MQLSSKVESQQNRQESMEQQNRAIAGGSTGVVPGPQKEANQFSNEFQKPTRIEAASSSSHYPTMENRYGAPSTISYDSLEYHRTMQGG